MNLPLNASALSFFTSIKFDFKIVSNCSILFEIRISQCEQRIFEWLRTSFDTMPFVEFEFYFKQKTRRLGTAHVRRR